MGNCGGSEPARIIVSETVVTLPKYTSEVEFIFKDFDKKFNYLKDISLFDYLNSIRNIKFSKTPGKKEEFSKDEKESIYLSFTDDNSFQIFIENNVVKHPLNEKKTDSQEKQLCVNYICTILSYMVKGQKDYYKNTKKVDEYKDNIKKYMIIIIGLLFCDSKDFDKINTLFSSISNEEGKIKEDEYLYLFIYMMIFAASFGNFSATYQLNSNNQGSLPTMKLEDRAIWDDYFGLYQVRKVFDLFKKTLFENKKELTYEEFFLLIQQENLAWILTKEGIRNR